MPRIVKLDKRLVQSRSSWNESNGGGARGGELNENYTKRAVNLNKRNTRGDKSGHNADAIIRCDHCRQVGHRGRDCGDIVMKNGTAICLKCGSVNHNTVQCTRNTLDFDHAECHICAERGHVSSRCPENSNAVLRNGGACKHCQSVLHFAKDCVDKQFINQLSNKKNTHLSTAIAIAGDDDDFHDLRLAPDQANDTPQQNALKSVPRRVKIVRF